MNGGANRSGPRLPFFRRLGAHLPGPATRAHVVPFLAWMVLLTLTSRADWPRAAAYAVRTALCLGALVYFRPWRYYTGFRPRHLVPAVAAGIGVFALWIAPEVGMGGRPSLLRELYLRFGILPFGIPPALLKPWPSPYDPAVCGWPLTLIRLAGSAFVIAIAEEFFWRGYLYRRLQNHDFLAVDPGRFDRETFWLVAGLFGLEHQRYLVGAMAGAVYGYLYLRTRDIRAVCVAHATTNFLLGLYVIRTGLYVFW
jgi:membrane protease YdiL (CAAX protease family)